MDPNENAAGVGVDVAAVNFASDDVAPNEKPAPDHDDAGGMLVSTAMAGNDPNEIAGAIAWVVVPADGPAPNTKLVPANGTDLILSVDVADGADMLPLLSEKADTPSPPVTAFSTEGATAVVGALSTFPSALDVVVVPNTTTFVLSFS